MNDFYMGRQVEFYSHPNPTVIVQYNHDQRICITQYSDDFEIDLGYYRIVAVTKVYSKFEIIEQKKIDGLKKQITP